MSSSTTRRDFLKGFLLKREPSVEVTNEYKIEGSSFDKTTSGGLENYLSWKGLNKDYRKKRLGYLGVTIMSIGTSIYGGYVTGFLAFILTAVIVELTKMTLDRSHKSLVLLAGAISFTLAMYGLYNTLISNNQSTANRGAQIETLENAIHAIDNQLRDLQNPIMKTSAAVVEVPKFNQTAYNRLVKKIAFQGEKLDKLKAEKHTYWQKKPNRRNKRTGQWMLDNPDKCTGSYCSKLQAKQASYNALLEQKKAMDVERENVQRLQKMAMDNRSSALASVQEKQKMVMELTRTRNAKQEKLMGMQENVKIGVNVTFSMTILFALLLFIEMYQYIMGNRLADMKSHKLRVNTLHDNFIARKEALNAPEKRSWFSKKSTHVEIKKSASIPTIEKGKLTLQLAEEIQKSMAKGNIKITRKSVFIEFEKYGISKVNKNYKLFRELLKL